MFAVRTYGAYGDLYREVLCTRHADELLAQIPPEQFHSKCTAQAGEECTGCI